MSPIHIYGPIIKVNFFCFREQILRAAELRARAEQLQREAEVLMVEAQALLDQADILMR